MPHEQLSWVSEPEPVTSRHPTPLLSGRLSVADRRARLESLQAVNAGRLPGQVVSQFVELIRKGELAAGDRLPPERELAERFGVGRNSIREALRELNMLGLVSSRHGEGTFVGQPDASQLMAPFRAVIELSSPAFDSIMEFRLAFEPGVAALAAQNLTEDGERRLCRALERFEDALGRRQGHVEHVDAAFHFAVAESTGNPTVVAVHQALLELLTTARSKLKRDAYEPDHRIAVGHRDILEAIVARDQERARATMHQHLVHVAAGVERT
jgi:GntR family transcriptional repressor for pyruvate dehydrogenase complex